MSSSFQGTADDSNGFAEEGREDPQGGGFELPVLLARGVVRSWPWVLLLVVLGAAIGLGLGLMQPNSYVSRAKLSLRMGAREQLSSEALADFDERRSAPPPTMVDELQMLEDRAIFEHVARTLGPDVVLQPPADPERGDGERTPLPVHLFHRLQGTILRFVSRGTEPTDERDELQEEASVLKAAKALREGAVVEPAPGSNVILVSYTSTSPELARTIVQALTNAFIERHREHFSIRALLERSRAQLEQARLARDGAASAYIDQVSQSGIAVLETQVPRLEADLSALEGELFAAGVRREEISRLRTSLSNRLQGIPAEVEVQRPLVMIPNEDYETLLALKRGALAKQQELLIQSRPSEETRRRAAEYDRQIEKLDVSLAATPKAVPQGAEMQENLGHAAMEARILDLEVEDEALPVKIGLLEARIDTKRARLGELQKELLGATMLRKDLAAARDAEESRHAHLVERLGILEALENIDTEEEANLRVLQAPTLEPEKVGPRRAKLLLAGLAAGTVSALAFALLRRRFERRLRDPDAFVRARGVPVLGVVPHLSALRRLRARVPVGGS